MRFLHAVLAEKTLTGPDRRADAGFVHGLAHRHQSGLRRGPDGGLPRRVNAGQNGGEIFGNAHDGGQASKSGTALNAGLLVLMTDDDRLSDPVARRAGCPAEAW